MVELSIGFKIATRKTKQEIVNVKQEIGEGIFEISQKLFNSESDFEIDWR